VAVVGVMQMAVVDEVDVVVVLDAGVPTMLAVDVFMPAVRLAAHVLLSSAGLRCL
jgi:hypothetical protein